MLILEVRFVGSVTVVDMAGSLVSPEEVQQFSKGIIHLVSSQKVRMLLLNLERVSLISNQGVDALIEGFNHVNRNSGRLGLINLADRVERKLDERSLIPTVFRLFFSEDEAVADLGT